MPRLLSVDDDPAINEMISNYFERYGFDVTCVESGQAARDTLASLPVDVVLLDLGLPGEDGLEIARTLRTQWNGPIIIVSGRGETIDRVVGLEVGADDYVSKPFDLRELLARVKAVMRRAAAPAASTSAARSTAEARPVAVEVTHEASIQYEFGGWSMDPGARRLTDASGAEVSLTRGEFDLLLAFVERPRRVLSRDQLTDITHNRDAGPFDRTIDVQIGRLRKKIEVDPQQPQIIRSVRGLGYQFTLHVLQTGAATADRG